MSDLAKLAGIVGSDGHLVKDEPLILVINKDLEFLENIVLPIVTKITGKQPIPKFRSSGFGDGKYVIRFWSPDLWNRLKSEYNIPSGAKSISITPPIGLDKKDKIDFLLGWIAGDGCVTNERTRAKIEIWSRSEKMITWFQKILDDNEIETRISKERKKKEHILRIGKQNMVRDFYKKFIIPHPKKQRRLRELLSQ